MEKRGTLRGEWHKGDMWIPLPDDADAVSSTSGRKRKLDEQKGPTYAPSSLDRYALALSCLVLFLSKFCRGNLIGF